MKTDPLDRPPGIVLLLQKARAEAANNARAADMYASQLENLKWRTDRIAQVRILRPHERPDQRMLNIQFSPHILRQCEDPIGYLLSEVEHYLRHEFPLPR